MDGPRCHLRGSGTALKRPADADVGCPCYHAEVAKAARPQTLSLRQERILAAVCREYVATGRPVSSRALVHERGLEWSTATVRNELAALEKLGLLYQPHASAGRVPTAAGLQHYVSALDLAALPDPGLARAVDRGLAEVAADPTQRLRTAVWLLSEALDCVAVSLVGCAPVERIKQLDVVRLVGHRVLVVLTRDDGSSRLFPVALEGLEGVDGSKGGLSDELLGRTESRLRWLCVGRTLPEAREFLLALWRDQKAHLDRVLDEAVRVGMVLCTAAALDPLWVQIAGQPHLARSLGPSHNETLRQMLALFEDVHRLAEVLFQLLPGTFEHDRPKAAVWVDAGRVLTGLGTTGLSAGVAEVPGGGVGGLSMVGCRLPSFQTGGSDGSAAVRTGALALLGPDRMDFAVVIPLVEYAARALAAPPNLA